MSRFIKFIPSEVSDSLRKNYPNAFLLLSIIAERARRIPNQLDGLHIGDAILGNPESAGLSRQQYRTALNKLVELDFIEIIYNGKNFIKREKSTIKITITGTLVNLKDSRVWDINPEDCNQHINQRSTNSQPTINHKQERIIKNNKEEEHTHIEEVKKVVGGCDIIIPFDKYLSNPKSDLSNPKADNSFKESYFSEQTSDNIRYDSDYQGLTENRENICQEKRKIELKNYFGEEGLIELTFEQHRKLLLKMTEEEFNYWVRQVEIDIGRKGEFEFNRKNQSHYHAILAFKEFRENKGTSPFSQKNKNQNIGMPEENLRHSKQAERLLKSSTHQLHVLSKHVEIVPSNGSSKIDSISYTENGFKDQLNSLLMKRGFKRI